MNSASPLGQLSSMPERRYSDDEVAEIFARATEIQHRSPVTVRAADGPTLGELQAIGGEAGIAPELVANAARSLDQPTQSSFVRVLGLPLGVASTVHVSRKLTDAEWERFVVSLRETFEARGVMRAEGSLRSWANGNLQVMLEPDGDGQRIRFRTLNAASRSLLFAGIGVLGVTLVSAVSAVVSGIGASDLISSVGSLAVLGSALLGIGALRLPGWARLRRSQMQALGERAQELVDGPATPRPDEDVPSTV